MAKNSEGPLNQRKEEIGISESMYIKMLSDIIKDLFIHQPSVVGCRSVGIT